MGFYTFIWYIYLFIWSYFIEMAKMAVYLVLFSYLGLFDKVAKNGGIFMLISSLLFGLFIWG